MPSKTGTPRKQLKRNLLQSPKDVPSHSTNVKKTPSKSPNTKRVRKCLEDKLRHTCSMSNPELPLDPPVCSNNSMEDIQNLIPVVLNLAEVRYV